MFANKLFPIYQLFLYFLSHEVIDFDGRQPSVCYLSFFRTSNVMNTLVFVITSSIIIIKKITLLFIIFKKEFHTLVLHSSQHLLLLTVEGSIFFDPTCKPRIKLLWLIVFYPWSFSVFHPVKFSFWIPSL